ncbi:MAG: SMC family ATPase [Paenibacillaceae bacterium]|nr:SMC family ATPase [Paenibacillaceae bacterium]
MKPVRLIVQAFGPYRDEQCIDFEALGNVFVIAGATGSGKTSLLDAMCYALYGFASGADRKTDPSSLRSQFARDDVPTRVDFVFRIADEPWRIVRQMAHKRAGMKTESGFSVAMYRGDPERLLCTRKADVDAEVLRLIGLKHSQFCQVVLLPQGEYASLLTAPTDQKEHILRTLFSDDVYVRLTEYAKNVLDQAKEHERMCADRRLMLIQHMIDEQWIDATTPQQCTDDWLDDALLRAAQHATEAVQTHTDLSELLTAEHDAMQQAARFAYALEESFVQLHAVEQEYDALHAQRAHVEAMAVRLARAERASQLIPLLQTIANATNACEALQSQHRTALEQEARANERVDAIALQCAQLPDIAAQRAQWQHTVHMMEHTLPQRDMLAAWEQEMQSQQHMHATRTQQIHVVAAHIAQQKQQYTAIMAAIQTHEHTLQQYGHAESQHMRVVAVQSALDAWCVARNAYTHAHDALTDAVRLRDQAHAAHMSAQHAYVRTQASELAMVLSDGHPCPVCGSTTHPQPAQDVATQDDRASMHATWLACEKEVSAYEARCAQWQQAIARAAEDVVQKATEASISLNTPWEHDVVVLQERATTLQRHSQLWRTAKDALNQLFEQQHVLGAHIAQLEVSYTDMQQQCHTLAAALEGKKEAYDQAVQRIPEAYRDLNAAHLDEAKQHLAHVETLQTTLINSHTDAVRARDASVMHTAHIAAQCTQMQEQLTFARMQYEHAQAAFGSLMSDDDVRASHMSYDARQELQKKIAAEDHAWRDVCARREVLRTQLHGQQRPQLRDVQRALDDVHTRLMDVRDARARDVLRCERIHAHKAAYTAATEQHRHAEAERAQTERLYFTLSGTGNNPLKLSFERYLLIAYLDRIVHAANARLRTLTNGQYALSRRQERSRGNAQSGLELNVYDAYTGQTRDVRSLSGGEKFHASLSLALAIVDCIQAHQGNVHMEMMLIDEGFGTLDEEAVQKAILALFDVHRHGRMIGVISHVAEIQRAIPTKLLVEKTKEGWSRVRLIVQEYAHRHLD